jgi:hypothetical protein
MTKSDEEDMRSMRGRGRGIMNMEMMNHLAPSTCVWFNECVRMCVCIRECVCLHY